MTTGDLFSETITALSGNKIRSSLTMLGIVIGIASVIALVAIGNGAKASITSSIDSLGSNLLTVRPGAVSTSGVRSSVGSAQTLTLADATAISAQVANVSGVAAEDARGFQITAPGTNINATVDGTQPTYPTIHNLTIAQGSFFSQEQVVTEAQVAILGAAVNDTLFGSDTTNSLGQTVRINGSLYTVIGITQASGGTGFGSTDDEVFVPISTAQQYLTGAQYITSIGVQAATSNATTQVENDITTLLLQRHGISDPANADFSVINQATILSTVSTITGTFTVFLGAIAGISLLVGGIGIMNMMLTSVTERTKEIGLRKAIGASEGDISNQFLMESVMLTLIGGVVGIALGWIVSFVVALTGVITPVVSLSSVLLAFGVSGLIGVGFGWYPARRAAKMNPIDALRYE